MLSNDFFTGGLYLGLLGGAVTAAVRLGMFLGNVLYRKLVTRMELREHEACHAFGLWMSENRYGQECRQLSVGVLYEGDDNYRFYPVPGIGTHFLRHKDTFLLVNREREEAKTALFGEPREFYNVTVFGSREQALALLEEAKRVARVAMVRRNTAFISDGRGGWERVSVSAPRNLKSVVLPGDTMETLVRRIETFFAKKDYYFDLGIPWRLGVGLFGDPGTGKTSAVRAVCYHLGLQLYVLDLTAKDFSDHSLTMSLGRLPQRCALLIEDVDEQLGKVSLVTLAGLLNALDGPLSGEGRVLFITSNEPSKLDGALVREGRLDITVNFGLATREQIYEMWIRFHPEEAALGARFAEAVPAGQLQPAALQEYLIARAGRPAAALADVSILERKRVPELRRGASP